MTPLEAALRDAVKALDDLRVGFALIGGLALATWAEPRITRDIDLAVAVDSDQQAESVTYGMRDRGYELLTLIDHAPTGRLGTVRMRWPGPLPVLTDLLFASSGIEPEIVAAARTRPIGEDLVGPVACPGHLVAMKLLSRNPEHRWQDHGDLIALAEVLEAEDVETAAEAAGLIVERGFHRDRDLPALLDEYLEAFRPDLRRQSG